MNRRITMTTLVFLLVVSLAGCGKDEKTESYEGSNTIEIKKDGSIINTITDSFDSELYDEELLEEFALREAAEYNHENGEEALSIKKLETGKEKVSITMEYRTADDFAQFNGYPFFCGTVSEAVDAGYDFTGVDFCEADFEPKEGTTEETPSIQKEQLLEMGSRKIIIANVPEDERLLIKTSGKILYINGASYEKKNLAAIEGSVEMPAYIVFK